jgi:PmbA protein
MMNISAYRKAFATLPTGVDEAEVNAESHRVGRVEVHGGELSGADLSEDEAMYLRVSGERTGYVYTQDPLDDPAAVLIEAFENGRSSEKSGPDEIHRAAEAVVMDFGQAEATLDIDTLGSYALAFERELLASDSRIPEAFISLRAETIGMRTVNSHGLDVASTKPLYILAATVKSEKGGRLYTACYNRTASSLDSFSVDDFAHDLAQALECQYDPEPFRSGSYRAILHRNVVYNIMSTAWQLFSGQRYLEGSCLFSGKLGESVAAECISLKDYPKHPDSGFDIPCDCEGSAGTVVDLLDRGRLAGLMHNLTTARALGAKPTGNAGRRPLLSGNIATDILVTPRNICVEPGFRSLDEMVEDLEEGILLTSSLDVFHSLNIASGAFSIPCKGVVVRKGRRGAATGSLMLSGNLGVLLEGIEEVGSDLYIGTMLALDNYGIGACSLQVNEVSLSGAHGD